MTALLLRLAPAARTVAWPALVAGALGCAAVGVAAALVPRSPAVGQWPAIGALALCSGAAFLFDDPAASTVGATPTPLARRRLLRVALALPLLGGVWAGALWIATAGDGAAFGPDARAGLSLQFAALIALTLATSAVALRLLPGEHVGWTGALAPITIIGTALMLPQRWALLAPPGGDAWGAAQQRWAVLLALGLLTLAWASRDPAGRGRSPYVN